MKTIDSSTIKTVKILIHHSDLKIKKIRFFTHRQLDVAGPHLSSLGYQ